MMTRRTRLTDLNPIWAQSHGRTVYLIFDCPEPHPGCKHAIPFTPCLDSSLPSSEVNLAGAIWQREGDTFETLTLTPSIRRGPTINQDGLMTDACACHIFIRAGEIVFCGDSGPGFDEYERVRVAYDLHLAKILARVAKKEG